MFKSRRFWIMLAVFFSFLLSVPALWYFWWYPNSWRGRFDRVQMGMTEEEVEAILGPPPEDADNNVNWMFYPVLESIVLGDISVVTHEQDEYGVHGLVVEGDLAGCQFNSEEEIRVWFSDDADIYVRFDRGVVTGRIWLGRDQPFDPITFFKSLLHL